MKTKKRKNLLFTAIFLIGCFYLFSQADEFIFLKIKFKTCPYGHTSLKVIRIFYEFPLIDSTFTKEIENNDIYLGGCVSGKESPEYKVICQECGFELMINENGEYWTRYSKNMRSFEIPLKSIIQHFPVIELDSMTYNRNSLGYLQEIRNDSVVMESVMYGSLAPYNSFEKVFLELSNLKLEKYYEYNDTLFYETNKIISYKCKDNKIEYFYNAWENSVQKYSSINFTWQKL